MTIKKKANGKYQVRVYVGYDSITGKRQNKYATCGSMKEARLKEAQLITEISNGDILPSWEIERKAQSYTFNQAYLEWFEIYSQQGLAQSTVDKTERYFNNHLLKPDLFGGMYFEQLTRHVVQERVNKFIPTLVKSKQILRYAGQVFKYAVDSEHVKCTENPLDHIRMVRQKRTPKREVRYYTEKQAKLFELGVSEYWAHRADYPALFTILLRTGARIGEVLALRWCDIDFQGQLITFDERVSYHGDGEREYMDGLKNGEARRVVEIDAVTSKAIRKWKQEQAQHSLLQGMPINDRSLLFTTTRGNIQTRLKAFNNWYNKTHTDKLPWLNIHGLRHTHATLLISNGVELKQVAERLGHKDITITANIYADVTPKARREVADRFTAIMSDTI
ncbi:tyrosine-type recombinase/integrase [Pediococcus pentosaceus]|uniref:tyrosine-type recombinase/integrase n=1 Tax=Pediococcus pentosaceus TaxID=1255 RepID=UPI003981A914